MADSWQGALARWVDAGLIDSAAAERIRAFEGASPGSRRLRWPVRIAVTFGGLMLAASVLLFVSSHWETLSPGARFAIVLAALGAIHVSGALAAEAAPAVSSSLHFAGTVALGGGIFLAGQIFHLAEHWPSGVLLWAGGAVIGGAVLRDPPQLALAAVLVPAWLVSEWMAIVDLAWVVGIRVAGVGLFLLALAYFTVPRHARHPPYARPAYWVGRAALLPATLLLWLACRVFGDAVRSGVQGAAFTALPVAWTAIGWATALALPTGIAGAARGAGAYLNVGAAAWALAALFVPDIGGDVTLYGWFALGAVGLAAWGMRESRVDLINMASVIFAATVIAFYFSQVMDRLGRSASLAGMGVLFLAGGWALERTRRHLVGEARESGELQ